MVKATEKTGKLGRVFDMPILKRYKNKEGYYISGNVPGLNRICTWQVSKEGIAFLRMHSIDVDETLPVYVFKEMLSKKFLYTGGSGFAGDITVEVEEEDPYQRPQARLVVHLNNMQWSLAMHFPQLSQNAVAQLRSDEWQKLVQESRIVVDDNQTIPARQLSPGNGGSNCKVAPHTNNYTWEFLGTWPEKLGVIGWGRSLPGLNRNGELFRRIEVGAERLPSHGAVAPGDELVFIVHRSVAFQLPISIFSEKLLSADEWEAWTITIPDRLDSTSQLWVEQLGYRITPPSWHIRLVSPVLLSYGEDFAPCVSSQSTVLLSVSPPAGYSVEQDDLVLEVKKENFLLRTVPITKLFAHSALKGDYLAWVEAQSSPSAARYICLTGCEKGLYHIRAVMGKIRPFSFRVVDEPENVEFGNTIWPLSLDISISGRTYHLQAFSDSDEPTLIQIDSLSAAEDFQVSANCTVSFAMTWSSGTRHERCSDVNPEALTDMVRPLLMAKLTSADPVHILLDAGAFGSIRLRFSLVIALAEVAQGRVHIPVPTLQKLYWLCRMISQHQISSEQLAPIPAVFHQTIRSLADDRVPKGLLNQQQCPAWLLPHLVQFTREISSLG
jgi:hypothetical protein